ncbi:MAG: competence/damage-inducible protein A [Oscillospiraceae bacterium]|jgi:nicotinamide-nucleotide amidase|nr:competence/damage-inducible protein A [Oscillospiraceae bacterium]
MIAEILCVGTELLLGDIVNTNAAFIAKELAFAGIKSFWQSVVGDNSKRLLESFNLALSRADVVITSGGLGPTYDDLTKETAAKCLGLKLELRPDLLENLRKIFARMGREMSPNNEKQALMPEGAHVFENLRGTAPGLAVTKNGKSIVMLPGPPRELEPMFSGQVLPWLAQMAGLGTLVSHGVNIFGLGESAVEDRLKHMMENYSNPTLAPYAKTGEVLVRVTASAGAPEEAEKLIAPVLEEIKSRLDGYVYGIDAGSLQNALVNALKEKKLKIAAAESCTGGIISGRITEVPGASEVFGCGLCAYSNEMKSKLLGVNPGTLEKFGAVSAQTAIEMAQGVRELSGADISISTSGIAGPGGGTTEKPVGLVYIGYCTEKNYGALELHLGRGYADDRNLIRYLAASEALALALKLLRLE